jgi:DNA-binding beta-propeller fold protein YncE
MRAGWKLVILVVFFIAIARELGARPAQHKSEGSVKPAAGHAGIHATTPVKLLGAILVPGNPLRFDISWIDHKTGRYYLAEAGNASVDIVDARNDLFLGRITGFHGGGTKEDGCGGAEGMGPSGVVVTSDNHLWADDAHGVVKVFDLANAEPPFHLNPIATISTGAQCRADEIGFDPKDRVIMVGNPGENPPFAALISSDAPYTLLAKIPFPDATGLEQPLWDAGLKRGRMLVTVRGKGNAGFVAVIDLKDPKNPVIDTTYPTPDCGPGGLALGPSQHLLVGCSKGQPVLILNALNGHLIKTLPEIPGADEVWYNPSDGLFYAPSGFGEKPAIGIIDAATDTFLQSVPSGAGAHSVAAFQDHIFIPIGPPTATAPIDPCSSLFGFPAKQGCIAVYGH